MLLRESVHIGKVVICRLTARLARLISCNSTWVLLYTTCRFARCDITSRFMDSLNIASMFPFIRLARTFLIRNKFLVLIQESLFKLIISLRVLSIRYTGLLGSLSVESTWVCLTGCILQVGVSRTVVGTHESAFDCVLARGDKFARLIDTAAQLWTMLALVLSKLIVHLYIVIALIMANFAHWFQVVIGHGLFAMVVDWTWRWLLNLASNLVKHRQVVMLVLGSWSSRLVATCFTELLLRDTPA